MVACSRILSVLLLGVLLVACAEPRSPQYGKPKTDKEPSTGSPANTGTPVGTDDPANIADPDTGTPVDPGTSTETGTPVTQPQAIAAGNSRFVTAHFSGSQLCADCHNGITDVNATDVSVETDWSSTMMANSARDPLFRAKLASEVSRNPGLQQVIEEKCSRCHTPMANVEAHFSGTPVRILPPGFLSENHPLHDAAMDGVSCTLCHQILNTAELGTPEGFSGQYSIGNGRAIFGPFENPYVMSMRSWVGFGPVYSAHVSDSKLCSSCHNLFTPVVDANTGKLTADKFPEQAIYSEWENSVFARIGSEQSCQDCHMPETDRVFVSRMNVGVTLPRDNFSKHYFVGGNTYMLDMLNRNKAQLGVSANNFETTISRTRDLLGRAASLEVKNASVSNGLLSFAVQVQNKSGHKLPSGYPARRVYLHVTVKDATGKPVFESGHMNADGSIVGVDSDDVIGTFEQHFDVITRPTQVQVYEAIMADTNNQLTYTLLNASSYLKDNRLLPTGFDKFTVSQDVKPGPGAMSDASFQAGFDQVTYEIGGVGVGPLTIEVELNYQALAYAYAQDLFKDIGKHEYIDSFKALDDNARLRKETIARIVVSTP